MKILIIIPIFNEENQLDKCLQSFVNQTTKPSSLILVNDGSTDNSKKIINKYSRKFSWITDYNKSSNGIAEAGKKIIKAFNFGKSKSKLKYDLIGKFDGDIILPKNYFEKMIQHFKKDEKIGICSGVLFIKKNDQWLYEDLHDKKHIRGALKLYSKNCFQDIGGLIENLGWDTVDELLAKYFKYKTKVDENIIVKHLRRTSKRYNQKIIYKQGELMYKLRYGIFISLIATMKMFWKNKKINTITGCALGYLNAYKKKKSYFVSKEQGSFIRSFRIKNIIKKIFLIS